MENDEEIDWLVEPGMGGDSVGDTERGTGDADGEGVIGDEVEVACGEGPEGGLGFGGGLGPGLGFNLDVGLVIMHTSSSLSSERFSAMWERDLV